MYWRGAYNNIGCDLLRMEVSTRWNMTYMMLKSGYKDCTIETNKNEQVI
jgi:hypothetical protein